MAINKKLIHFNTKANFITQKLSANVNDTQYYTYNSTGAASSPTNGAPDIKYNSIVFIKDTQEIWTHGQLYENNSIKWRIIRGSGIGLLLTNGTIIDYDDPYIKDSYTADEVIGVTIQKDDISIIISPTMRQTGCYFCGGSVVCSDATQYSTAMIALRDDRDGEDNTTAYRTSIKGSEEAVNVCYNTMLNGQHCYLPSFAELTYIMNNKDKVNTLLGKCGGNLLQVNRNYWSSSLFNRKDPNTGAETTDPNGYLNYVGGYYGGGNYDGFNVQGLYYVIPITKLNK